MSKQELLSSEWAVKKHHTSSYTGGKVALSGDQKLLLSWCSENVAITNIATGEVVKTIVAGAEEGFTSFALQPGDKELVTSSTRSFLLRRWDLETGKEVAVWKGHDLPVLDMCYDATGLLLATASADRTVRVWNASKTFCTHNFRGHTSMVSRVCFHPDPNRFQVVSCSEDGEVRVWDLLTGECHELRSHVSLVTNVAFSQDGQFLITAARDQIVNVWSLKTYSLIKTTPVFESIEGMVSLPPNSLPNIVKSHPAPPNTHSTLFATGGDKAQLRIWRLSVPASLSSTDSSSSLPPSSKKSTKKEKDTTVDSKQLNADLKAGSSVQLLHTLALAQPETKAGAKDAKAGSELTEAATAVIRMDPVQFMQFVLLPPGEGDFGKLIATTSDNNFCFYNLKDMSRDRLLLGFNDEIYDLKCIPGTNRVVLATNSAHGRVLDLDSFDADLLSGHRHVVLSVDVSSDGQFLLTSSKDHTLRIWRAAAPSRCVAICEGHSDAVGAARFAKTKFVSGQGSRLFAVSASRDRTIKLWDCTSLPSASSTIESVISLKALVTKPAHEKDLNCLAVAPNDKLVACGSQDKTISLWSTALPTVNTTNPATIPDAKTFKPTLNHTATLRGHKRGVWCVEFSPVDKVLASASGDKTIKVWSMTDFTCLKTLEGHSNSVLRVMFFHAGLQLLSTGADAVVKVWNIKTNECLNTFEDKHGDKIWAASLSQDEKKLVTGAADSVLNVWADVTLEQKAEEQLQLAGKVLKEQKMMNALRRNDFPTAMRLAFELRHPRRLLTVIEKVVEMDAPLKQSGPKLAISVPAASAKGPAKATEDDDEEEEVDQKSKDDKKGEDVKQEADKPSLLAQIVRSLKPAELNTLLEFAREWNTNAKHCHTVHRLLRVLFTEFDYEELKKDCPVLNEMLPPLLLYSERHFHRLERLQQKSFILDYIFQTMSVLSPLEDETFRVGKRKLEPEAEEENGDPKRRK